MIQANISPAVVSAPQIKAVLIPILLLSLLVPSIPLHAQGFQALHGSPYAGSMSSDYNPAAILDAPYRWDVTLFGIQGKTISNAATIRPYNIFSNVDSAELKGKAGYFARDGHVTGALNLLHVQYRINHQSAVSFGINLRGYMHGYTSPFYWSDTIRKAVQFTEANANSPYLQGGTQGSSWFEYNLGYSRIISENEVGRWQAGVQLRIMNAVGGGYARVNRIEFKRATGRNDFQLIDGNAVYGYSKNVDVLDSNLSVWRNYRNFMRGTSWSLGLDLGVEYVRYLDDFSSSYRPGEHPEEYNWKISAALLDLGTNTYDYGRYSTITAGIRPNVYASTLDRKFGNFNRDNFSLHKLNDSLRSIVQQMDTLRGNFSVNNPLRLLVNFDKSFPYNLYLNAELQLPFYSIRNASRLNTRELTVLALTPRWETKAWGVYLPIQHTTQGNTWLGLAVKAGPLIVGLHNLGWIFSKSSLPNGGGYLALQIHPWKNSEKDAVPCPTY